MTTRRIQPEIDPSTGKPILIKKWMENRKKLERDRRIEERKAKEQAAIDAAANPPPPRPTPKQFMEQLAAEQEGKRQAKQRQADLAAANRGPVNHFREQAESLEKRGLYLPTLKMQHGLLLKMADEWDRKQAAAAEQAAKQQAIDSDPMVKLARDYAAGMAKLAPPEFQTEVAECAGIAQAGDAAEAWRRMNALDKRIFAAADKAAADARQSRAATDSDFQEKARIAEEARERSEQSASFVEAAE